MSKLLLMLLVGVMVVSIVGLTLIAEGLLWVWSVQSEAEPDDGD